MAPGNVFADIIDRGPWLFYDRLTTAAGQATQQLYAFFTVGISNTKTMSDTNLTLNRLSPPQAFSVQSVGFIFGASMLLADVTALIKNYYHEFKILSKVYSQGPLDLFPGGAGLAGSVSTNSATAAQVQWLNNGLPTLTAARRFPDYPRIIPAEVPFVVNVNAGAGTFNLNAAVAAVAGAGTPAYGGLDLRTVLDGILDREVQ